MAAIQKAWFVAVCTLTVWNCPGQSGGQNDALLTIQDAIGRNDLERASVLVESALREHPDDGGLFNLRGIVHARRSEFADARSDFSQAVKLTPDLIPAWQNLARACQVDSEKERAAADCARRAWSRVLQWQPVDPEANRGMALEYERSGNYSESLRSLAKAKEDTALTSDLMIRCMDLIGLKRLGEAQTAAKQLAAREDFQEGDLEAMCGPLGAPAGAEATIVLAEALDARNQLKIGGLKLLAVAYEGTNRLGGARTILERAALAEPNNAAHLLELARVAEKQNEHEAALGYLGHARDLTPNDPQVHFLFGVVASKMDLPMEARRSLDKALELAPADPDYNYAMGSVILSTRDAATAGSYFQKYLAARPGDAQGHYALGIAEFRSGDYGKAKAEMRGAEGDARVAGGAEYFLGRIARLEGDTEAAKQHLEKAIRMLPAFSESHTELARVWLLEGKQDAANAELKRALELDPNSFEANAQLLIIYKRTHDARALAQGDLLKKLDEDRSKRAELMLRTVEVRP
jgi:tetratricopeptide (TPR) repeat protein